MSYISVQFVVGSFGLAASGVIAWAAWQWSRRPGSEGNLALFHELCAAHELDSRARRLLLQMARLRRLSSPSQLFLAPELWEANEGSADKSQLSEKLASLRARLFGEDCLHRKAALCSNEHASL